MKPATHTQGDSFTNNVSTRETPSQGTLEGGYKQTSKFIHSRFKHANERASFP